MIVCVEVSTIPDCVVCYVMVNKFVVVWCLAI